MFLSFFSHTFVLFVVSNLSTQTLWNKHAFSLFLDRRREKNQGKVEFHLSVRISLVKYMKTHTKNPKYLSCKFTLTP